MTDEEILQLMESVEIIRRYHDKNATHASEISPNIKIASGVSKNCFIFTKETFVVKFPKYVRINEKNECQQELEFYQNANNLRVQKALPETSFLGYNSAGIPFYKQQKLDYSCKACPREKAYKYMRMTEKVPDSLMHKVRDSITSDNQNINILWLKMVWILYGEKFTRALVKWMIQNQVNDLHTTNLGYLNDRPMIMDFCGYHR